MDADTVWHPAREQEADSNNMVQTGSTEIIGMLPSRVYRGLSTQRYHASEVSDIATKSKSMKPFPFLSLPGEIRNFVYEYTCIYKYRGAGDCRSDMPVKNGLFDFNDATQPPITRVNRQLRRETLGLFYSEHEFQIEIFHRCCACLAEWLGLNDGKTHAHKVNRGEMDPYFVISKLMRHFHPRMGVTTRDSNLKFLTNLSVAMEVAELDVVMRLKFTMSTTVLDFKKDADLPGFWGTVKTDGLDWNDEKKVRKAYVEGIKSCRAWARPARDPEVLDGEDAHESGRPGYTATKLARGMSLIARELPQLARHVCAYFEDF